MWDGHMDGWEAQEGGKEREGGEWTGGGRLLEFDMGAPRSAVDRLIRTVCWDMQWRCGVKAAACWTVESSSVIACIVQQLVNKFISPLPLHCFFLPGAALSSCSALKHVYAALTHVCPDARVP